MENNVMFLGSYGVGKTTILLSYINNKFIPNAISTIGMDNYLKQFSPSLTIKFWDTCGQEQYNSINFTYIKKADGIILVYDPNESDETIKSNLTFWVNQVYTNNDIVVSESSSLWLIANNKNDEIYINEAQEKKRISDLSIRYITDKFNIYVINKLKVTKNVEELLNPIFTAVGNHLEECNKNNDAQLLIHNEKNVNNNKKTCHC